MGVLKSIQASLPLHRSWLAWMRPARTLSGYTRRSGRATVCAEWPVRQCLIGSARKARQLSSVALREHGFSDDEIWDITAFFGMSNRLANFTSLRPNDEFYMLGRT